MWYYCCIIALFAVKLYSSSVVLPLFIRDLKIYSNISFVVVAGSKQGTCLYMCTAISFLLISFLLAYSIRTACLSDIHKSIKNTFATVMLLMLLLLLWPRDGCSVLYYCSFFLMLILLVCMNNIKICSNKLSLFLCYNKNHS